MQSHRQSEFDVSPIWPRLGGLPTLKRLHGKIWTRLRGLPGLACKRDQIKMREYMDWRLTPPKRVTSPTWGPPPPCKQALRNRVCSITTPLFHSETKQYAMNWFYMVYAHLSTVWKYVFLLLPDWTHLTNLKTKILSMLGTGYVLKITIMCPGSKN